MAKNLERAKQFQRTLWTASGRAWKEEDFDKRWIFKPFGTDWDAWYDRGLAPVPFCALCGEDQLTGATHTNRNSFHLSWMQN